MILLKELLFTNICNTYLKGHRRNINYSADMNILVENCKNSRKRNVIFKKVVSY